MQHIERLHFPITYVLKCFFFIISSLMQTCKTSLKCPTFGTFMMQIHVMSLDFTLLSAFAPFWVYNDMTSRKW